MAAKLNRHGFVQPDPSEPAYEYAQMHAATNEKMAGLIDRLVASVAAIRASNKLTAVGKDEEIKADGRLAGEELQDIVRNPRAMLQRDLEKHPRPKALPDPMTLVEQRGTPGLELYTTWREIREHLAGLDPVTAEYEVNEAAANDDIDVLLAVTQCHRFKRPVSEKAVAAAVAAWLEKHTPEAARPAAASRELLDWNVRRAQQLIARETGLPAPGHDAVAAAALGLDKDEPAEAAR